MNLDLLFDTPWWLPVGLAAVGAAVWVPGNKRRDRAMMNIGLVLGVAALALAAVSYLVDTPRESADKATRQLIDAIVRQDRETARAILHPNAHVKVMGGSTPYANREDVLRAIDLGHERLGLESAHVLGLSAVQTQNVITVTVNVVTQQAASLGRPIQTRWQIEFLKTPEGWNAWAITLVEAGGVPTQQAERQFPSVR